MKKLLVILVTLGMIQQADAQVKIRAGIEGGYNSTWLFNKHVSDAGDNLDYKSSFAGEFGIGALAKFNKTVGLSLAIMSSHVNQKLTERALTGTPFETTAVTEQKLSYIAIPLLFRITTQGPAGFYFEIGPQFNLLSKAKFYGVTSADSDSDNKNEFKSTNITGELGLGVDVKAGPVTITAGLRFGYGLGDASKTQDGETDHEPTHTAVGGLHLGVAYNFGGTE